MVTGKGQGIGTATKVSSHFGRLFLVFLSSVQQKKTMSYVWSKERENGMVLLTTGNQCFRNSLNSPFIMFDTPSVLQVAYTDTIPARWKPETCGLWHLQGQTDWLEHGE